MFVSFFLSFFLFFLLYFFCYFILFLLYLLLGLFKYLFTYLFIYSLIYLFTCLHPFLLSFKVFIFSSLHVSGEQLDLYTGVAATLRYPLPDIGKYVRVSRSRNIQFLIFFSLSPYFFL